MFENIKCGINERGRHGSRLSFKHYISKFGVGVAVYSDSTGTGGRWESKIVENSLMLYLTTPEFEKTCLYDT